VDTGLIHLYVAVPHPLYSSSIFPFNPRRDLPRK
jgi:hypothetical protein